jgi:tetratricopeptide (TPR) repeat protein
MFQINRLHRSTAGCRLICISAISLLLAAVGCTDQKRRADELVRSAAAQARSGEHADAVRTYAQALALDTRLPEAHYGRGVSQTALGQHAAAIDSLQTVVRLKPEWAEAWHALATAQRATGETALAVRSLAEAIRLKSDFSAALYDRACAFLKLRDPAAAIADLDAIIALNPRHPEARLQRGRCVWQSSPEQAIEDLTLVLQSDKNNVEALILRGNALSRSGQFENSLRDLNQACQLQPRNPAAWLARGRTLRISGQLSEAASDLKTASSLDPRNADILCELALTAKDSAQPDLAQTLLQQALQIQPGHAAARLAIADSLAAQHSHAAALEELQKLLAEPEIGLPANAALLADVRLRRAASLHASGKLDEALGELRAILLTEPHHEQARLLHARILQQLQRHKEALADLTRLISNRRNDPEALLARALSNAALNQLSAALHDLDQLLNRSPGSLPALSLRARIRAENGQTAAALDDLEAAIAAAPDQERDSLLLQRLRILHQTGQAEAALAATRQLTDAAFANPEKLRPLIEELQNASRHSDALEILNRAANMLPEQLPGDLALLRARLLAQLRQDWDNAAQLIAQIPEEHRQSGPAVLLAAEAAVALNRPAEAAQLITKLPTLEQPPELRQQIASALLRNSAPAEAEKLLNALVAESPADEQLRELRLQTRVALNAWSRAAEDAEYLLRSQPRHPDALLTRAIHLAANGQITAAADLLQIPAALPQPRPETLWTLAQCQTALHRRQDARETINRLLELQPAHHQARLLRVRLAIELEDFNAAAADLHQLLQNQPNHEETMLLHGSLMLKMNRHIDALSTLTRLHQINPQNADALELRAHTLHALARNREAARDLELALKINPQSLPALLLLASLTAADNRDVEALRLYDQAIAVQPQSFTAWHNRGSLLFRNGRLEQAAASWKRALLHRPSELRTRLNLAAALRKLNQDPVALEEYSIALHEHPESNETRILLSNLLLHSSHPDVHHPEAAEKIAQEACEHTQYKNVQYLRALAEACHANDHQAEAARWNSLAANIAKTEDAAQPARPTLRTAASPREPNVSRN